MVNLPKKKKKKKKKAQGMYSSNHIPLREHLHN